MKLAKDLRKAIDQLVKANEADAFKGCGDPDEYENIELRLQIAKVKVRDLLVEVEQLEESDSKNGNPTT